MALVPSAGLARSNKHPMGTAATRQPVALRRLAPRDVCNDVLQGVLTLQDSIYAQFAR